MSLKSRRIAGFLTGLISIATLGSASYAQPALNFARVLSCNDTEAGNSVVLQTTSAPILAPKIQYLPGPDGQTMMVADFAGLSYMMPPHIIRPVQNGVTTGIEEIRVGQFQANPPICRVAACSHNPAALKSLSFSTTANGLVVKWSGAPSARKFAVPSAARQDDMAVAEAMPPNAPPRNADPEIQTPPDKTASTDRGLLTKGLVGNKANEPKRHSAQLDDADMPPPAPTMSKEEQIHQLLATTRRSQPARAIKKAPSQAKLAVADESANSLITSNRDRNNKDLTSASQEQSRRPDKIEKSALLPKASEAQGRSRDSDAQANEDDTTKKEPVSKAANKTDTKAPGVPMARLTIVTDTGSSEPNAAVQLLAERRIAFKSFRLHAPERYIIDLDKPGDLDEATVSSFQDNNLLRSVRIGVPNDKTCRIVFDLADETVQVQEKTYAEAENILMLTIKAQPVSTKTNRSLEGVSLVLDAGHGGTDPGAQRGDVQEKDMTIGIVNQLKKRLESGGAHITMTRVDDTFVSLEDRVKLTNTVSPNAFVSVHINALESTSDIKGIETYYQTDQSKALADAVHKSLVTMLGVPDRGIRKARFYVINHTPVPAILAEVGFISNKEEREKLNSSDYQAKVADALAQGVAAYLGRSPEMQANSTRAGQALGNAGSQDAGTSAKPAKSLATSLPGRTSNAEQRAVK